MSIGDNIRKIRKEKKMTQKQLADKTDLSIGTIQGYEQCRYTPKFGQIESIASALEVNSMDISDGYYIAKWIPAGNPPKEEKYVLLSFSNYLLPEIGMYREDKDGSGAYYIGESDLSCVSHGIIVNGWMPLPRCMED